MYDGVKEIKCVKQLVIVFLHSLLRSTAPGVAASDYLSV